jgi:glycosyltransferase involved in cell wall biosynthesis
VVRPLRIGVWCDYGVTLTPTEGIGVFIWNLIGGLLELDEPVQVVMLVAPGDQHLVTDLQKRFPGRLHIVPPLISRLSGSSVSARVLQLGIRFIARMRRKRFGLNRRMGFWQATLASQGSPQPLTKIQLGIFSCLEFLKVIWQKILAICTVVFNVLPGLRSIRVRWAATFDPLVVCRNAGCDVWLIPSNRFRYPLTFPSVLVIHDLVHVHYPDAVPDDVRWELERLVPARAAEATLCACMSRFIRDTDLQGHLRLPPEKIRLISPAPPQDFSEIKQSDNSARKFVTLTRPYLFYPAAFRSYKNHVALIEALRLVNQSCGQNSVDLVLTGIRRLPPRLARKIAELGMRGRVHILGCVDRQTLAALYQEAFATIVPSLYEQGSFPIYEALHWGCPVACSNIPSLIEQSEPLGDAMIYFNPHDPRAIAEAIFHLRDNRESILLRQQSARPSLWKRTWRDAARDWLTVLREVSDRAGGQVKHSLRRSA